MCRRHARISRYSAATCSPHRRRSRPRMHERYRGTRHPSFDRPARLVAETSAMTEFWESRDEAEPRRAELPHNRVVTSDDQHELSRKLDLINRRIEKLYRLVVVGRSDLGVA